MPDIFSYLDYRKYLLDWLEFKSKLEGRFSKRKLATLIGCDSAFLIRVLQGYKELTLKFVQPLVDVLDLDGESQTYLELMVLFSKANTKVQKNECLSRLTQMRKKKVKHLDSSLYEFYENWYYTAIREILEFFPFSGDYSALARQLNPPIRTHHAKKAIKVLEKLNLIYKDNKGFFQKSASIVTSGEGWKSLAVAKYQLDTLDLAKEAFNKYSSQLREFSTLTLSLDEKTMKIILDSLKDFRKKCLELAKDSEHADRVYQMNFQTFPISKLPDKNEK